MTDGILIGILIVLFVDLGVAMDSNRMLRIIAGNQITSSDKLEASVERTAATLVTADASRQWEDPESGDHAVKTKTTKG